VPESAEEVMERHYTLLTHDISLNAIAARLTEELGIKQEDVNAKGRYRRIVEARSLWCYWTVRKLGVPMSTLEQKPGISIPSISVSVACDRMISEKKDSV
jgi:putative transposase